MKNIHIGEIIKAKVAERGLSAKELAKAINCDRTNIYKIYQRKSIDIEQLLLISKVLDYNFIEEIYFASGKEEEHNIAPFTIEIEQDSVYITKQTGGGKRVIAFRKEREE